MCAEVSDAFQAVTVICGQPEANDNGVLSAKRKGGQERAYVLLFI